ncbi:MAG: hypothetical protein B7Z72_12540, partial [Gemmatimonadetes bacterium 21-71-4]
AAPGPRCARHALDEIKAGLGGEYTSRPWKTLLGWEHVAAFSDGTHVTEERGFVEGTAESPLATPWEGRQWWYDARFREVNTSSWRYGVRG